MDPLKKAAQNWWRELYNYLEFAFLPEGRGRASRTDLCKNQKGTVKLRLHGQCPRNREVTWDTVTLNLVQCDTSLLGHHWKTWTVVWSTLEVSMSFGKGKRSKFWSKRYNWNWYTSFWSVATLTWWELYLYWQDPHLPDCGKSQNWRSRKK